MTAFAAVTAMAVLPASASAERLHNPLRFFEGRTEMVSMVRVVMKKPYRSRTIGRGQILPDGSLALVQSVHEEAAPPRTRHWKIRQAGSGRFVGTMSEALGPVEVSEVGGSYRFRFRMKGNLAVEQLLTPLPGGQVARSKTIVRKFGVRVATSEGTIRRV